MNERITSRGWYRSLVVLSITMVVLAGCTSRATPAPPAPIVAEPPDQASSPTRTVKLQVTAQAPGSRTTISTAEAMPSASLFTTPTTSISATVSAAAEPLIFIGLAVDQKCGHGDVVAADGHQLYASPRLQANGGSFLELLPEGTRVDIVDCRLWTDEDDLSWLAVRTPKKKLGWMLVQPDKFYVTLYPVPLTPPRSATGIPAGSTVAYVPPSECKSGPVSNEAMATSVGIDFIPVVGDLKGIGEAMTGCDMVTGESLGNWRWLGLLGLVGLAEVAMLRHGDELADSARLVDNLDDVRYGDEAAAVVGRNLDSTRMLDDLDGSLRYGDDATEAIGRNADTVSDALRGAGKLDNVADAAADSARAAGNSSGLSDEAIQALAKLEQPCSFTAGTPVSTPVGLVPIDQIQPGDLVLAHDPLMRTTSYLTVTAVSVHMDSAILTVTIGADLVVTTPEHPFFVGGRWVSAGALRLGDRVASALGTTGQVERIESADRSRLMYNLTIARAHTYFVGPGQWLVHNACARVLRSRLTVPKEWEDEQVAWQAHHIIPGQWEDREIVQAAERAGWDIDGASNGIPLPYLDEVAEQYNLPAHHGYHKAYSDSVEREIAALDELRLRNGWDDATSRQAIERLVSRLRASILGGSSLW